MSGLQNAPAVKPADIPAISSEDVFLLFVIGCVFGFIVETIFCHFVKGGWESRRGMVYGPFSQIYGFGAVLMTLVLSPFAGKSVLILFLGSGVLGGIFEVLCSIFQEKVFGTVSWNYSHEPLPLFGGRTSLKFMLFWGVLGTSYIGVIHPILFSLIALIPLSIKSSVVSVLFVLISADLLLSCVALQRWQDRRKGVAPQFELQRWVDGHFPDRRMERIYPDMLAIPQPGAAVVMPEKNSVYGHVKHETGA